MAGFSTDYRFADWILFSLSTIGMDPSGFFGMGCANTVGAGDKEDVELKEGSFVAPFLTFF